MRATATSTPIPAAVLRTNLDTNPRAVVSSNWLMGNGTGGASTATTITGVTDGPVTPGGQVNTYRRFTVTTAATGGGIGPYKYADRAGVAGDAATVGYWLRVSVPWPVTVAYARFLNVSTVAGSGTVPPQGTIPANTWRWIAGNATATGPYTRTQMWAQGAILPVGATVDVTAALSTDVHTSAGYFDGSTSDTPTRDYAWTGAANSSTSTESTVATTTDTSALALTSSHALTCDAYLFTSQPSPNEAPARRLGLIEGTFVDDAARGYARGYDLRVRDPLEDIAPGSWVRIRVGVAGQARDLYTLPTLFVSSALADGNGTQITCVDIGACLDELVYERDATLTGTLRSLASALTTGVPALTHPPDVSQVPALPIPANTVAEFGQGRWDVLLSVADQVGVDLLWTDAGDLLGVVRTNPAPSPVARLDAYLVDPGQGERNRATVRAVVQVSRDKGMTELVGVAFVESATGVTIADRQDGDATTTQAQADELAAGLLARRRSERNVREIDVAPAPWIEAGVDTISLAGSPWWVRALTVQIPSLATRLTLRDAT